GQLKLIAQSWMSNGLRAVLLAVAGMWLGAGLSSGAEVGGIYTEATTKDLGEITKIDFFKNLKFRGWIDVYFEGNFNNPKRSVAEANQAQSVIKSRDLTIEGRTFDVHDRSFSLSLAELEVEKVPDVGGIGFKLDLAFGDTQDIIVDTIKAASGGSSVSDFDRYVQHASLSYVAPIGRGLRLDIGKFVSHIGGETIESIKNHNYSRAFFFTYATPTLETGIRMHYDWTDALYTELYVLNGWNVTSDNNKAKTFGPSIGWTPSPQFSVTFNYLVGNEQTDNDKLFKNLRHIFDAQLTFTPIEPLNFHLNLDYAWEDGALNGGTKDAQWGGITGWVRYKVTDVFEPVLRIEYYRDDDGFTTGVRQSLVGVTFTLNYKITVPGKFAALLLRPEYRFDHSNENFFTHKSDFRSRQTQHTLGIGAVVYF
ncbi:MAG TPA: outer membrane beta-barrel protein, partial [Candidatus Saccharimonadia bacterium]|nr:outer membrane beta-barrel protein [Candidatus Saccharimonadia bacterium]